MNKLQERLLTLLQEIDNICRSNNIDYYLAAGCALGAVRNGGFLPWDDDADIYITRDNWEKLRKVIYSQMPENRSFVCEEDTPLYNNPIGRYVDKDSTFMIKSQVVCGECCGLVVEFFIMDPMPNSEEGQWKHRRYMKVFAELLSPYFVASNNVLTQNTDFDYALYKKYRKLSKIIGKEKTLSLLKKKFAATPEEGSPLFCMRWGVRTLMYPSHMFGKPTYVSFAGHKFPLVQYPEKTFRVAYGDDWMYVPQEEGQISHNLVQNIDQPYEKYKEIYMPLLDREAIVKSYQKRKDLRVVEMLEKCQMDLSFAYFAAEKYAKDLIETTDLEMLSELLEKGDSEKLNTLLEEYYSLQFRRLLQNNNMFIPVSDDFLYIAAASLVQQGQYYKALKLLKLRKHYKKEWSEKLIELEGKANACRELSIAIYDEKNTKNVKKLLTLYKESIGAVIDFALAELWLMDAEAEDTEDYEKIQEYSQKSIEKFGDQGELIRYKAKAFFYKGEQEEAKKWYTSAVNTTRNGLVWKEAKEAYGIVPDGEIYEEK